MKEAQLTRFGKFLKKKNLTYYYVGKCIDVTPPSIRGWATGYNRPQYWNEGFQRLIRWLDGVYGEKMTIDDFIL